MFNKECVILHAPHSSLVIPEEERKQILLNDDELRIELLAMTDHFVDELFFFPGVDMITSLTSRLVVDMEKFRDDKEEIMAPVGMGAVYIKTSVGKDLRESNNASRELLLSRYYDPYHSEFEHRVEEKLNQYGRCVILDCHSFPAVPLPYELDQDPHRPDICLGTCDFHTSKELLGYAVEFFSQHNLSVAVNRPFSGTIVPIKYYQTEKRVCSMMVELNKGLYMDESNGQKAAAFNTISKLVLDFMQGFIVL
jgi:N-formylglutamate amidohydrolase